MAAKTLASPFADAPEIELIETIISRWQRPALPDALKDCVPVSGQETLLELSGLLRRNLLQIPGGRQRSRLEVEVIGWLYDFIRLNIKRGRVFDLHQVLPQGSADCLGYAKLFTLLGRLFGLDVGVVEVVKDNQGRFVPHTAALARLANGQLRFIDLWYGSKNIHHQRIGLHVRYGETWQIMDLERQELDNQEEVCYLPDRCADAITLYIRGNQHLNSGEFASAIKHYAQAIALYPGNARFFYNRAIAYENLGQHEKADADYTRALRDEAAIARVLATEHDEVTCLIDLDARGIDAQAQEMYLLNKGFTTGRVVAPAAIARRFGLSEAETKAILSWINSMMEM